MEAQNGNKQFFIFPDHCKQPLRDNYNHACINIGDITLFQVRIWSQPDKKDQTIHALTFAGKAYDFFADYFNTPEIVPKAGKCLGGRAVSLGYCHVSLNHRKKKDV